MSKFKSLLAVLFVVAVILGLGSYLAFQSVFYAAFIGPLKPSQVTTPAQVRELAEHWDTAPSAEKQQFMECLVISAEASEHLRPSFLGLCLGTARAHAYQEARLTSAYCRDAAYYIAYPTGRTNNPMDADYAALTKAGTALQEKYIARTVAWHSNKFLAYLDYEDLL